MFPGQPSSGDGPGRPAPTPSHAQPGVPGPAAVNGAAGPAPRRRSPAAPTAPPATRPAAEPPLAAGVRIRRRRPERSRRSGASTRSPAACAASAPGTASRTSARSSPTRSRRPTSSPTRRPRRRREAPRRARRRAVPGPLPLAAARGARRRRPGRGRRGDDREKLIRRHPHVFGEARGRDRGRGAAQLGSDQARGGGPGRPTSRSPTCPRTCRRLLYARKIQRRARLGRADGRPSRPTSALGDDRARDAAEALDRRDPVRARRHGPPPATSTPSSPCGPPRSASATGSRTASWQTSATVPTDRTHPRPPDPRLAGQPDGRGRRRARQRGGRARRGAVGRVDRRVRGDRASRRRRRAGAARASRRRSRTSTRDRRGADRRPRHRAGRDRPDAAATSTARPTSRASGRTRSSASRWPSRARPRPRPGEPLYLFLRRRRGDDAAGADDERAQRRRARRQQGRLPGVHGRPGRRAELRRGGCGSAPRCSTRSRGRCKERGLGTTVGDEGGFAPDLESNEAALEARDRRDRGGRVRAGHDVVIAARPGDQRAVSRTAPTSSSTRGGR